MSHLEGGDKWQGLLSQSGNKTFKFRIFLQYSSSGLQIRSVLNTNLIFDFLQDFIESEEGWCRILFFFFCPRIVVYYSRRSSRLLLIWNSWHSHFFSLAPCIWSRNYILYNWVRTIMMYGSGSPSRQLCVPFFVSISFLDALFILCHESFSRYRFEAAS